MEEYYRRAVESILAGAPDTGRRDRVAAIEEATAVLRIEPILRAYCRDRFDGRGLEDLSIDELGVVFKFIMTLTRLAEDPVKAGDA